MLGNGILQESCFFFNVQNLCSLIVFSRIVLPIVLPAMYCNGALNGFLLQRLCVSVAFSCRSGLLGRMELLPVDSRAHIA